MEGGMTIQVLNAVENVILLYGKENARFISNPYQHFAEKLGYKSKNYLYRWFKERDASKIGLKDIDNIIKIVRRDTNNLKLIEATTDLITIITNEWSKNV